jgi:hypothetical protein
MHVCAEPGGVRRVSNGTALNVQCGATGVTITANTQKPFQGHIFVKNHFNTSGCAVVGDGKTSTAEITLPFGTCDMTRRRSVRVRTFLNGHPVTGKSTRHICRHNSRRQIPSSFFDKS